MKLMQIKNRIASIITLAIVSIVFFVLGFSVMVINAVEKENSIHWSFENGFLSPFRVVEGDFGEGLIASWTYERNYYFGSSKLESNKDGYYYLSTVETDSSTNYNESYMGTIVSPTFRIQSPTVSIKLAGGPNANNYVAIVRANDEVELVKYSLQNLQVNYDVNGDGIDEVIESGHLFRDVELTIPNNLYQENEEVYIKIVDGTTSGWGYISVDDIRAEGEIIESAKEFSYTYSDFHWSFEDGTMSPFMTNDNFHMPNVCNADVDWNGSGISMNKDGVYYMSTIGVKDNYVESATGEFVSSEFVLNPSNPTVNFRIGGGVQSENYVAICDATTGAELTKISPQPQSATYHPLQQVSLTVPNYKEGTRLFIKIVDGTTSNFGFVHVDDFRFSGSEPQYDYLYEDVVWSFENELEVLPFKTNHSWGGGLISTYVQGGTVPHGARYLNTVQTVSDSEAGYDNSFTGEFFSTAFRLDPNDPTISFDLIGYNNTLNYVAVCDYYTDIEVKKVFVSDSWAINSCTIDMTGAFKASDALYLKIVDDATDGWVGVDNIRFRGAYVPPILLDTLEKVQAETGYNEEKFNSLTSIVQGYINKYGDEYSKGTELLFKIAEMQERQEIMASLKVEKKSGTVFAWIKDIKALEKEIQYSNPVFGDGLMIFTVRNQYREDHHNTHNMFPSYNGEISGKEAYTPGGAVRVLNLKTGVVTTLLEDSDGVFRDLDVSYEGNKILLSYRESADTTYNIVEYSLSADRTQIVQTKQLTSLSTADDMDPMYMPSGNIVFSSTRDPKYVMCNRHISANIYHMEPDGANIVKITSSTLFERPTDVLPDGRILYDRWEYNDRDFGSAQGLWTVYEDGTKQETYYGNNSPTGATIEGKAIPGTQKVIATLSSTHDVSWGALAIIDRSKGVDGRAPVEMTWPRNVINNIGDPGSGSNVDAYKSLPIKYEDPEPLSDEYFLASRTLSETNKKMGVYLLDIYGNETLLYEDATNMSVFDATIIRSEEKQIVTTSRRNYNDDTGTFFVQNVYEGTNMEGVEFGSVKYLRIVESLDKKYYSHPQQWTGEGQQNPGVNWHSFEVKRVIGEVPVYADGSAYFEVPQDVFVYFQLLDENGRMIQSMRSGTLVQSGETTGCIGCHDDRRTAPSTSSSYQTPLALSENLEFVDNPDYVEGSNLPKIIAINVPDVPQKRIIDFQTKEDKLVDWNDPNYFAKYTDLPTMNYLTEVQPIFTNNCLQCHGYDNPQANLSLVPDKDVIFNASYINLWLNRGTSVANFGNLVGAVGGGNTTLYNAKAWGSYNSPLVKKLFESNTHNNLLTEAEKRRIAEWVDLNGTYYGDYTSNYASNPGDGPSNVYGTLNGGRSPLSDSERQAIGDTRTLAWHAFTLETLKYSIYFDNPSKSPILKNLSGTAYTEALSIIESGLTRLRINPDVDWRGLTYVPGTVVTGNPLKMNPYKMNKIDEWRTEKVDLYDEMEKKNREAKRSGQKLYDSDHNAKFIAHNALWPGWAFSLDNNGNHYTELPQ